MGSSYCHRRHSQLSGTQSEAKETQPSAVGGSFDSLATRYSSACHTKWTISNENSINTLNQRHAPTPFRTQPVNLPELLRYQPGTYPRHAPRNQSQPFILNSPAQDASQAPRVKRPCLMTSTHLN